MVKLSDIARELGISVATVSNAFTGRGRMNDQTRNMIKEKAKELGYEWAPRKSVSVESSYIVIVEGFSLAFTTRMLDGIYEEAKQQNLQLPIFNLNIPKEDASKTDVTRLNEEIDRIVESYDKPISGAIYVSQYAKVIEGLFKKHCFPTVGLFCTREKGKSVVHYDDHQGAYTAVRHMVHNGCRHIAMISGPIDSIGMFHRSSGYQRALIDHRLAYNPKTIFVGDWNKESGYLLAKELLHSQEEVDGIFVQNDYMAAGVLKAIREEGLDCPKDISLVGFDNSKYSRISDPMLTTINPPFEEMGKTAVKLMVDLSNGANAQSIFLPCELIRENNTVKTKYT